MQPTASRCIPTLQSIFCLFADSTHLHRPDIQLPGEVNVGIYDREPNTKRLSIMACLRPADASPEMVVDWEWR